MTLKLSTVHQTCWKISLLIKRLSDIFDISLCARVTQRLETSTTLTIIEVTFTGNNSQTLVLQLIEYSQGLDDCSDK